LLLLTIALPLGVIMSGAVREAAQRQVMWEMLAEQTVARGGRLVGLEVERRQSGLLVVATLHSAEPLERQTVAEIEALLSDKLQSPLQLEVVVLPVVRSGGEE